MNTLHKFLTSSKSWKDGLFVVGLNLETTLSNKHAHKQCPIYTGLCVYLTIVDALHRAQKKVFFKNDPNTHIYKNNTIVKLGGKHFYLLEQSFELAWRLKNKKLCDSVWAFRDQEKMSDPLELESPLWASLYILGNEPGSPERVASALHYWGTSPALLYWAKLGTAAHAVKPALRGSSRRIITGSRTDWVTGNKLSSQKP